MGKVLCRKLFLYEFSLCDHLLACMNLSPFLAPLNFIFPIFKTKRVVYQAHFYEVQRLCLRDI